MCYGGRSGEVKFADTVAGAWLLVGKMLPLKNRNFTTRWIWRVTHPSVLSDFFAGQSRLIMSPMSIIAAPIRVVTAGY